MTIDILIEALEMLRDRGGHPDYKDAVIHDSLRELDNLAGNWPLYRRNIWGGAVHVVSMDSAIDMQNTILYDIYGKLAKERDGEVPFGAYMNEVRKQYGFENTSMQFLKSGYDVINDLWYNNEGNGENNPDGTYHRIITEPVTPTGHAKKKSAEFKVLSHEYLNTGGNCMVGISTVWLPDELRTIYALTNEDGCTLARVDYISNEMDIDDYDELMIESTEWDRTTGEEKYFELYRHCYNQYLKCDYKHFGYIRGVPYHLLSDELQRQVSPEYLASREDRCIDTDGEVVFNQEEPVSQLQEVKDFKAWHDTAGDDEKYCPHSYTLSLAGRTIKLPFMADVWNAVDTLLQTTIEEW